MVRIKTGPHPSKVAAKLKDVGSERDFLFIPAGLGLLGVLAVFFGRGLSAAVPGTVVGLDGLVNWVLTCGAFSSQLFAISGAVVSLRLALWLFTLRNVYVALRVWVAGAALFVCVVVFLSAQPRLFALGPLLLASLSWVSGGLLFLAGQFATRYSSARFIAPLMSLTALIAAAYTAARWVALNASAAGDAATFNVSRAMSTVASILDLMLLVGAGVWLWLNSKAVTKAWTSVLLVCLPALFLGTPQSGPRYVAQRIADAFTSHPDPFLPSFVTWWLECAALTLAMACVSDGSGRRARRLAVAFALLGRTTSDRPLGALLLLLAALCLLYPLVSRPISLPDEDLDESNRSPGPISA
jgi:hypothetical protein